MFLCTYRHAYQATNIYLPKLLVNICSFRLSTLTCGVCVIKLFYGKTCQCCHIVSQSVCHCHPLSHQSNIWARVDYSSEYSWLHDVVEFGQICTKVLGGFVQHQNQLVEIGWIYTTVEFALQKSDGFIQQQKLFVGVGSIYTTVKAVCENRVDLHNNQTIEIG